MLVHHLIGHKNNYGFRFVKDSNNQSNVRIQSEILKHDISSEQSYSMPCHVVRYDDVRWAKCEQICSPTQHRAREARA